VTSSTRYLLGIHDKYGLILYGGFEHEFDTCSLFTDTIVYLREYLKVNVLELIYPVTIMEEKLNVVNLQLLECLVVHLLKILFVGNVNAICK